jgi:iron complex outermembrane receptor protein
MYFDLQRVEVLKGPQGTLYGRGSTAGSMNIMTQKALLGEVNGHVSAEAGNFGLFRTEGAINIPVADKLAFRVSGRILKRDGYNDAGFNDQDA